jgi:hypothetical protein
MDHSTLFHDALVKAHDIAKSGTRNTAAWNELLEVVDSALNEARRREIERLRERREAYKGQVFAGSQEIERLLAALQEIAGHEPLIGGDGWIMRNRARAALSTSKRGRF